MKINRFVALAAIALLVISAMGVIASRSLALGRHNPAGQSEQCDQNETDREEVDSAQADTDQNEVECGDQGAADGEEANSAETEGADDAESAPAGAPAITSDQARDAALAVHSGTVKSIELESENGALIYTVEFTNGVEVEVDAATGEVLKTEQD